MTLLNRSQNSTGYIQTGGFFSLHTIPRFLPFRPLKLNYMKRPDENRYICYTNLIGTGFAVSMNWVSTCVVENCSLCSLARHSAHLTYSSVKNTFKATVLHVSYSMYLDLKGLGHEKNGNLVDMYGYKSRAWFLFFQILLFRRKKNYVSWSKCVTHSSWLCYRYAFAIWP